mmetsp:Transcript_70406/g.152950  ORF Transcript_70406/g.152950 Transcript_70406/m.152950 type:complete len:276 (-) Transcript_70406:54-881(-)
MELSHIHPAAIHTVEEANGLIPLLCDANKGHSIQGLEGCCQASAATVPGPISPGLGALCALPARQHPGRASGDARKASKAARRSNRTGFGQLRHIIVAEATGMIGDRGRDETLAGCPEHSDNGVSRTHRLQACCSVLSLKVRGQCASTAVGLFRVPLQESDVVALHTANGGACSYGQVYRQALLAAGYVPDRGNEGGSCLWYVKPLQILGLTPLSFLYQCNASAAAASSGHLLTIQHAVPLAPALEPSPCRRQGQAGKPHFEAAANMKCKEEADT